MVSSVIFCIRVTGRPRGCPGPRDMVYFTIISPLGYRETGLLGPVTPHMSRENKGKQRTVAYLSHAGIVSIRIWRHTVRKPYEHTLGQSQYCRMMSTRSRDHVPAAIVSLSKNDVHTSWGCPQCLIAMWTPYSPEETVPKGVHNVSLQFGHHIVPKRQSLRVSTMSLCNMDTIFTQRDCPSGSPHSLFAIYTVFTQRHCPRGCPLCLLSNFNTTSTQCNVDTIFTQRDCPQGC